MDYSELAKKYGGAPVSSGSSTTGTPDVAALAAKYGGKPAAATPPKQPGLLGSLVQDVASTLVTKPGIRAGQALAALTGQAAGALGFKGEQNKIETRLSQPYKDPITGAEIAPIFGSPTAATQVAGEGLKSAAYLAPVGRAAELAGGVAKAVLPGASKALAPFLGQIASFGGTGYAADVGQKLSEGKTGTEAATPGFGTALGVALPFVPPVLKGGINAASRTAGFATSQATGLERSTIKQILDNPSAFNKDALGAFDRSQLEKDVAGSIRTEANNVSQLGKEYEPLRTAGGTVSVPRTTATEILDKYGLTLGKDGKIETSAESRPISPGDLNSIESFLKQYGSEKLSNNAYFNAKQALSQLSKYDSGRTDTARQLARDLRGAYEKIGDKQIAGLQKLDERFGPVRKQLNQLKKDYFGADGSLKDGAATKIANLTNKGREQVLARLEKVRPGVTKEINVLRAIEDIEKASGIKVGTYARGGIAAGAVLTGNIPAAIAAVVSQPEIAVPLLRGLGYTKNQMAAFGKILKDHLKDAFPGGIKAPGDQFLDSDLAKSAGSYLEKNPPSLGMAIKDVNKMTPAEQSGLKPGVLPNELPKVQGGGPNAPAFQGFEDLSTKLLEKLKGRKAVSKQFILDATNAADLKQPEKDLFRNLLQGESENISVKDFADKVKTELLPLERRTAGQGTGNNFGGVARYESITLPDELRGPIANYSEHLYSSPIKTSAGGVHFGNLEGQLGSKNYFAHTRVEDLPSETSTGENGYVNGRSMPAKLVDGKVVPDAGTTRRVIEVQSDLFQKGRLEGEGASIPKETKPSDIQYDSTTGQYVIKHGKSSTFGTKDQLINAINHAQNRDAELSKLAPYKNTWQERIVREEVKQAALDGKTKLQFPTGDTAMKIEGLGGTEGIPEATAGSTGDTFEFQGQDWTTVNATPDSVLAAPADSTRSFTVSDVASDRQMQLADDGGYSLYDELGFKSSENHIISGDAELKDAHNWVRRVGKYKDLPELSEDQAKAQFSEKFDVEDLAQRYADEEIKDRQDAIEYLDSMGVDEAFVPHEHNDFEIIAYDPNKTEQIPLGDGEVDTNHPIYKYYEKELGRYLQKRYKAQEITDDNGVTWFQVDLKPEMAKAPVEAFGVAPLLPLAGLPAIPGQLSQPYSPANQDRP